MGLIENEVSEAQSWFMAGVMGSLHTSLKAIYDFEAKRPWMHLNIPKIRDT